MQFSSDLERQLNGYGLTTAHILYRVPDFETVLQTYVWQDYDLAPDFPTCRSSSTIGRPISMGLCTQSGIRISVSSVRTNGGASTANSSCTDC